MSLDDTPLTPDRLFLQSAVPRPLTSIQEDVSAPSSLTLVVSQGALAQPIIVPAPAHSFLSFDVWFGLTIHDLFAQVHPLLRIQALRIPEQGVQRVHLVTAVPLPNGFGHLQRTATFHVSLALPRNTVVLGQDLLRSYAVEMGQVCPGPGSAGPAAIPELGITGVAWEEMEREEERRVRLREARARLREALIERNRLTRELRMARQRLRACTCEECRRVAAAVDADPEAGIDNPPPAYGQGPPPPPAYVA